MRKKCLAAFLVSMVIVLYAAGCGSKDTPAEPEEPDTPENTFTFTPQATAIPTGTETFPQTPTGTYTPAVFVSNTSTCTRTATPTFTPTSTVTMTQTPDSTPLVLWIDDFEDGDRNSMIGNSFWNNHNDYDYGGTSSISSSGITGSPVSDYSFGMTATARAHMDIGGGNYLGRVTIYTDFPYTIDVDGYTNFNIYFGLWGGPLDIQARFINDSGQEVFGTYSAPAMSAWSTLTKVIHSLSTAGPGYTVSDVLASVQTIEIKIVFTSSTFDEEMPFNFYLDNIRFD